MRKGLISYIWKGQEVDLDITIEPADYSVGIMGPGIYDLKMLDGDGKEIALTDDEFNAVVEDEKLLERVAEVYYGVGDE